MSREPYLSQTEQWWHRSGFSSWQRSQNRIAEETQPIQSHGCQQQPLLTLDHRLTRWRGWNKLWELCVSLDCSCCSASAALWTVLYCTSRVGAGVDGQILGYPPQDLLLRLSPIFTLQQLFVRVGQVKLCWAKMREKQTTPVTYRYPHLRAVISDES